jgi:cytochrome c oxidase subunit 2
MKNKIIRWAFLFILFFTSIPALAGQQLFEIKARKFSYNPNMIKVNKGDEVTIRLLSEDVTHGLYLDAYGLETKAHPGQDGVISFIADKTGRFSFRCSATCGEFHPYMVGFLVVRPNTPFLGFAAAILVLALGSLTVTLIKKRKS